MIVCSIVDLSRERESAKGSVREDEESGLDRRCIVNHCTIGGREREGEGEREIMEGRGDLDCGTETLDWSQSRAVVLTHT